MEFTTYRKYPDRPQGRGLSWFTTVGIGLIQLYRYLISPVLPSSCRFSPSCSYYAEIAIKHHGLWRGGLLSILRLLKCHPWHAGGVDLVPHTYSTKYKREHDDGE